MGGSRSWRRGRATGGWPSCSHMRAEKEIKSMTAVGRQLRPRAGSRAVLPRGNGGEAQVPTTP